MTGPELGVTLVEVPIVMFVVGLPVVFVVLVVFNLGGVSNYAAVADGESNMTTLLIVVEVDDSHRARWRARRSTSRRRQFP